MKLVHEFWEWLSAQGFTVEEPRPRLNPVVEQAVVGEAADEESHGEKEPDPVAELSDGVRLVKRDGQRGLLCVAECTMERGFWGVSISDLAELTSQPLPWAVVLLHRDKAAGYWFDSAATRSLAGKTWQPIVPGGTHYEVREGDDVRGGKAFRSPSDLLGLLKTLG